jgi:hypothetical protein
MRFSIPSVAFMAACIACPGQAVAQAWIGQIVGNMAAQAEQARKEAACRAGTPASDKTIAQARAASGSLLEKYFSLSSRSRQSDLKKVFALNDADTSWKDENGIVPVTGLGSRLDEQTPTLAMTSFVVGGDGATARGIWEAHYSDPSLAHRFYAVDFTGGSGGWFGGGWKIWHLTIAPQDRPPSAPAAFCHFDKDQAW